MPDNLKLNIACDDFEIVSALEHGHVKVEGIDLHFEPEMTNPVRHGRMVRDLAFDICELNVSTYLIARDQGVPIIALPVFLFRKFRHGNVFVHPGKGLKDGRDLNGKRIGCPNLQPASNVWIAGILQDFHGFNPRSATWVCERDEDARFDPPADLRLERVPKGKTALSMLLDGEIDALMTPLTPQPLLDKDPRIARLFPDYVAREKAYFEETGLLPIMHVTAVKQELVDRHPWIVTNLMKAFEEAKTAGYRRVSNVRVIPLAWFGAQWEEERQMLGPDPWKFGLDETNRRNLETIIRYTHEQGLTRRRASIEELFVGQDV
jgi:4,5-dihydroxyphthalate decarboxylase